MMNTRALMELIVVNVGYDLGIIPRSVFFMLVLMALTTTYVTTPLLVRLLRGSETESVCRRANFMLSQSGFDNTSLERLSRAVGSRDDLATGVGAQGSRPRYRPTNTG
jgi:hypothetical protein